MPPRRRGAKAGPGYRFDRLRGKVWRADVPYHAYELARANDGAPGVDGMTFGHILAPGLENGLYRLGEAVRANLHMNRFLTDWRQTGRGEAWKAHVNRYEDGFVSPADGVRDISPLRGLSPADALQDISPLRGLGPADAFRDISPLRGLILGRVRNFLVRRHKVPARYGPNTMEAVSGELGIPRPCHRRRQGVMS